MAEHGLRGMAAAMALLSRLQADGAAWTRSLPAGAIGRDTAAAAMAQYMRLLAARLPSERAQGLCAVSPTGVLALPPALLVVGTKGKGSTAAQTESILRAHGLRTGLFTSPHLLCATERLRLDGVPLSRSRFLDGLWACAGALEPELRARAEFSAKPGLRPGNQPLPPGLPGFNLLALLALRVFSEEAVDVMVLEAGVGGRLDAINVVPAPVAVAVTTLDYDHMELLGGTLTSIATEKAGVMRAGVPAVTAPQRPEAMAALCLAAAAARSPLLLADPALLERRAGGAFPALGLAAPYQRVNAAIAVALTDIFLASRARAHAPVDVATAADELAPPQPRPYNPPTPLPEATIEGLRAATWPGRAQTVDLDARGRALSKESLLAPAPGPAAVAATAVAASAVGTPAVGTTRLLLDGAHTEASMAEAVRWLHAAVAAARPSRLVLVFSCGHDKPAAALLLPLSTLPFDRVYMCVAPAGLSARRMPPTVDQALADLAARRQGGAEASAQGHLPPQLAPLPSPAATTAPAEAAAAWPRTLADLWQAVHKEPALVAERARMCVELGDSSALPPHASTRALFACASAADALRDALACPPPSQPTPPPPAGGSVGASGTQPHTIIVVTGSLYLVGAALEHVGWVEPRAAEPR